LSTRNRSAGRSTPIIRCDSDSYSERQLHEAALDRLSREIAVVQHVTGTEAVKEIEGLGVETAGP
jgi:RNA polymerase-interacting CarD/CdnL/TRCF family regulator